MKKTIKYKVFKLMKGKGTIARKDLCLLIFKAQGMKVTKDTKYRPGYYGNNIKEWVRDGLLEQPNGRGYRLTKLGLRYLENPEVTHYKIVAKREKARADRLINNFRYLRNELAETQSQLRDIEHILNRNN